MYRLVISSKFKRAFRKFARRNPDLQTRIEETIAAMENEIFADNLGTHKLDGKLSGYSLVLADMIAASYSPCKLMMRVDNKLFFC